MIADYIFCYFIHTRIMLYQRNVRHFRFLCSDMKIVHNMNCIGFFCPFWLFLFYTCSFSIANILLEWYLLRFDFVYFNSLSPRQSTLFVPNAVLLLLVSFKLFFTAITVVFNEFQFYCLYLFFIFPFRIKFTGFMLLFCWCAPFIQRFFCRIHVIDTFIFQTIFYTKWCK